MNGYDIKKVLYDNNDIYTYIKGSGNTNYVFITGWANPTALSDMCEIANEISKYGKCIIIDRFGYGKSSIVNSKRSLEQITKETKYVLDSLNIKNNIILIGHSMGTFISVEYAKTYYKDVKGLILIDSYPTKNWLERSAFYSNYFAALTTLLLKKFGYLKRMDDKKLESILFNNQSLPEDIKKYALDIARTNFYNKTVLHEFKGFMHSLKDYYHNFDNLIHIPITCICRNQTYKNNLIYKEKLDQVNIVCIPNSSHYIHHDHKDLVLDEIKKTK